jgi:hypothetical protein
MRDIFPAPGSRGAPGAVRLPSIICRLKTVVQATGALPKKIKKMLPFDTFSA